MGHYPVLRDALPDRQQGALVERERDKLRGHYFRGVTNGWGVSRLPGSLSIAGRSTLSTGAKLGTWNVSVITPIMISSHRPALKAARRCIRPLTVGSLQNDPGALKRRLTTRRTALLTLARTNGEFTPLQRHIPHAMRMRLPYNPRPVRMALFSDVSWPMRATPPALPQPRRSDVATRAASACTGLGVVP